MRRLVIDTATPHLSVAMFDGEALVGQVHRLVGRGHAECLMQAIADMPEGGRADVVSVGCGPGSFTGIRIGIAAARALAFAWGADLEGFSTPALIAASARQRFPSVEPIAVVTEGGHGEWFVAIDGLAARSLPPTTAVANVAVERVCGSRSTEFVALRGWGQVVPADADCGAANALAPAAFLDQVRPVYGRPPDAQTVLAE